MFLNNNLILKSVIFGVILAAVAAYPEYEDDTSNVQPENTQNIVNVEMYNAGLQQQQQQQQQVQEDNERKLELLNNMDMDISPQTEVSLKNVRNISDNQLSSEYISIEHEHEDEHNVNNRPDIFDKNTSSHTNEQNIEEALSKEDDYEIEIPLSKNNRMGRLFTTPTTTIPQYIRRMDDEKPIVIKKDINNVSGLDYAEDEIIDHMLRTHINKIPLNKTHDISSNEETDKIVPLAMKYYDEIPPENPSSVRHRQEVVSSEDYYENEYHEPVSTTTTTTTAATTIKTPDDINLRTLATGLSASTTTNNTTRTITTSTTTSPLTTTFAVNIPIMDQFDLTLLTTLAPLPTPTPNPPPFQPQTQSVLGLTTTTTRISNTKAAAAAVAAAVAASDKKGKQIPLISTVPVLTTTTTTSSRRRLLPHEQLRNYIEDAYIRMPLAVIIDPSAESLEKTKTLWNDAMRTNLNIKIVLVTLNESEDSPAAFTFNNTRQFLTGLNSIKERKSGDVFRGISHAAELVPYDSAVFISTAQLAKHTDQVQDSAITLLKKRIRLYLIWFGERSLSENETQDSIGGILGEVGIRSGGEILHIVSGENSQELEGSTLTIVADALRGSQEVDVPVDTTLSSLHVKIDKLMRRAVLETPNGEINLKKLVKFKTHSITPYDDEDKRLDAYVPLTKLRKATVYRLKMIPEDLNTEYGVFIRGERKADTFLDDMIKHYETYFLKGHTSYPARERSVKLKQSPNAHDSDADVLTHSKIQFPSDESKTSPKNEVETFSTQEIHQNSLNNKTNVTHSLGVTNAHPQERNSNILYRTNTKIEMGTHSQILIAPGVLSQLYFEVTNTGYEASTYNVQVVDEKRYLIRLTPQSLFLRPGQMATVTVTVFVPQNTPANTVDHITFSTSTSVNTASLTVNVKVITTIDAQDNTPPSISWTFGSRCEGVSSESSSCSERFWNMYITAQDFETGIMRLQATPSSGLIYTKSYTVGTTEPLSATYVASCCENKVTLVAFDVAGNQRSQTIDVRDLVLTEASIAAIVLGAILLLLLIILLIAAIIWCCRRRKIVLDLPTYRSHSTRSME